MREARIHLRHVRDLLKSLDPSDAYNGLDCSSLSFLNVVTQGDILGKSNINCKRTSVEITPLNLTACFSCFICLIFQVRLQGTAV